MPLEIDIIPRDVPVIEPDWDVVVKSDYVSEIGLEID